MAAKPLLSHPSTKRELGHICDTRDKVGNIIGSGTKMESGISPATLRGRSSRHRILQRTPYVLKIFKGNGFYLKIIFLANFWIK